MAIGGSILEVSYNHPTLGAGFFYPKGDADGTIDLGGYRTADDDNSVDGAGKAIYSMTPRRWSVQTEVRWDMVSDQELERLVALSSAPEEADFTFTHISGAVYGGRGKPVGDIQGSTQNATSSIKFSGSGRLKKI